MAAGHSTSDQWDEDDTRNDSQEEEELAELESEAFTDATNDADQAVRMVPLFQCLMQRGRMHFINQYRRELLQKIKLYVKQVIFGFILDVLQS